MGAGGVLKSGKNLFAGGNTANHRAALQDENFLARLGEIGRGHQAIVAGANDDRVVFCHGD